MPRTGARGDVCIPRLVAVQEGLGHRKSAKARSGLALAFTIYTDCWNSLSVPLFIEKLFVSTEYASMFGYNTVEAQKGTARASIIMDPTILISVGQYLGLFQCQYCCACYLIGTPKCTAIVRLTETHRAPHFGHRLIQFVLVK